MSFFDVFWRRFLEHVSEIRLFGFQKCAKLRQETFNSHRIPAWTFVNPARSSKLLSKP